MPTRRGARLAQETAPKADTPGTGKEPLDIDEIFRRLRKAVAGLPKAAMFDLRDRGYDSPFEQLVGSLISARTRDETTLAVCLRLFAVARTPEALAALDEATLTRLLDGVTFADAKARDLKRIACRIVEDHGGRVPDSMEALTAFRGVGPKIAALTGLCRDDDAGADHGRPGRQAAGTLLDRDQRKAGPVRQVRLHPGPPEMLDLSAAVDLPAGGRRQPALTAQPSCPGRAHSFRPSARL